MRLVTRPGNLVAHRLGEAHSRASKAAAGDHIDRGLALIRELEAQGFKVYFDDPKAFYMDYFTGDHQEMKAVPV